MSKIQWTAIVLAGGKGTRMKSPLPKVLHPVAGRPMIQSVIEAVREGGVDEVRVVIGYGDHLVRPVVETVGGLCFQQAEQKGTADAVKSAEVESLDNFVLIINGDHPLITADDIRKMIKAYENESADLCVVSAKVKRPGNFGRIVRHKGEIAAIVEAKDASAQTLAINEVNTGLYLMKAEILQKYLGQIGSSNSKGEFYLTDLVSLCKENNHPVGVIQVPPRMSFGVNTQLELSQATRLTFKRKARELMEEGVVIVDPSNTYIEPSVHVGKSSVIYPGSYLRGSTKIGSFSVIEANSYVVDSKIGDSTQIRVGSHLEKAHVQTKCSVGPYARLRPDTLLENEVHVGNFVELKKTTMRQGAKAGHLTYLGDADIGARTNIGCGTITCNYAPDRKKYKTKVGADVFVGSDTQFVAPVEIGDGALIGSGSTITKNVPERALAVARGRQFTKENYVAASAKEEKSSENLQQENRS